MNKKTIISTPDSVQPLYQHQQELMEFFKREIASKSVAVLMDLPSRAYREGMAIASSNAILNRALADSAFLCGAGSKSQTGLKILLHKMRTAGAIEVTPHSDVLNCPDYSSLEDRVAFFHNPRMYGKTTIARYLEYIGRPPAVSKLAKAIGFDKPASVTNIFTLDQSIRLASMQATSFNVKINYLF